MKKNICAIATSALLAGTACAFAACGGNESDKQAFVSLDINPAIELIVDKDNNVVSVRGENEDGQVLLYEETGIKGEKIDAAIEKITDLAVKYGYLDEYNKVVDTIVTSGSDSFAKQIRDKVNASVTSTAAGLGLTVTTDGEGAYSLLRQLEEFKKQYPNNKAIQNLSVQKFKLALSVSETGKITLEAAVALDDAELIDMLKEASAKIEEYATTAYTEAKTKAFAAYDKATEVAGYAVYTTYYLEKMLTHPASAYYGGVYQAYASAAKGFNAICDVAELAASVKNYPLDEAQINAVVTALGMDSADALKNSKGEITVESVEAYADKLFKNSPASEKLEQTKAALSKALSQTETALKEKVNELTAEYKPQIESAASSAMEVFNSIESLMAAMPESVKTILNESTADLKEILSEVEAMLDGDKIELDELRSFANRLDEKAQEYLNKIKADLSAEEWEELESRKASVIAKMTEQKKVMEKALEEAENSAKAYLSELKASRKNAEQK